MAIFKQAAPLPIEPSAVSQGFEDFISSSNPQSKKLSGKELVIDELDRRLFQVARDDEEYYHGMVAGFQEAIGLIRDHIK